MKKKNITCTPLLKLGWNKIRPPSRLSLFTRAKSVTYLAHSLLLPVEHRSMETARHLNLFWASVSNSLQVYLALPTSSSAVLLLLFLGRPRPLFPCGFHLSACLVALLVGFLKVSPIQLHLRLLIWVLILSCSAFSHSSSLLY